MAAGWAVHRATDGFGALCNLALSVSATVSRVELPLRLSACRRAWCNARRPTRVQRHRITLPSEPRCGMHPAGVRTTHTAGSQPTLGPVSQLDQRLSQLAGLSRGDRARIAAPDACGADGDAHRVGDVDAGFPLQGQVGVWASSSDLAPGSSRILAPCCETSRSGRLPRGSGVGCVEFVGEDDVHGVGPEQRSGRRAPACPPVGEHVG